MSVLFSLPRLATRWGWGEETDDISDYTEGEYEFWD